MAVLRVKGKVFTSVDAGGEDGDMIWEESIAQKLKEKLQNQNYLVRMVKHKTPDTFWVVYKAKKDGNPLDLTNVTVVRLDDGICYTVAHATDCGSASSVVVLEVYGDCEACKYQRLLKCGDPGTSIITYSDMTPYGGDPVLKLTSPNTDCYVRDPLTPWTSGVGAVAVAATLHFPTCDNCNGITKYKLTQVTCTQPGCNPADDIYTTTDLHAIIGKYIKIAGYCYLVSVTVDADTPTDVTYQGPFDTCNDCLTAPLTDSLTVITGVSIVGNDIVFSTTIENISDGKIIGFCPGDDITLAGTDCGS